MILLLWFLIFYDKKYSPKINNCIFIKMKTGNFAKKKFENVAICVRVFWIVHLISITLCQHSVGYHISY